MIKFIIFIFILIQFIYSQDKGLSSFEKENYKESFDYYLKVLESGKMIFLQNLGLVYLHLKIKTLKLV